MTAREHGFVKEMARTGAQEHAARRAGYPYPAAAAARLMHTPAINQAIVAEQTAILFNELLPAAINTLRDLLQPTTPAGARVQAVKIVLDRTGVDDDKTRKELHEMTADELERRAAELRAEQDRLKAEALGNIVDVTPANAQSEPNTQAGDGLFG